MILDKDRYMQHIKDKDQIMNMRRILDKVQIVLDKHIVQSTDFMDPYERRLAKSIINQFMGITYKELGGFGEAERKIILIYPDYCEYNDIPISISALMIEGSIGSLSHRDFLGGILSLGINREKIGDILIHESQVQIIVKDEVFEFILVNLERIGRKKIHAKQISLESLELGKMDYKDIWITVSSLRLDALISSGLNLSRVESKKLIEAKRVKINWEPIERVFKEVKEGDIISVKGYGRFILYSMEGISRKGKIKAKLRLLK